MLDVAETSQDRHSSGSDTSSLGINEAQQSPESPQSATSETTYSWQPPDITKGYKLFDRELIFEEDLVIKKELPERDWMRFPASRGWNESPIDLIAKPIWGRERLMNDFATLRFIAANTTIRVPECRFYDDEDGCACLEMERIKDAIPLDDIFEPRERATLAEQTVEQELEEWILPQLRSFKRDFVGSVDEDLPLFPPSRVYGYDRRSWPHISSMTNSYVLCHNDLGPHNILVHPETFKIVSIIDWEYAGFYLSHFELPLWRWIDKEEQIAMYEAAEPQELAFFGIRSKDDLVRKLHVDATGPPLAGQRWSDFGERHPRSSKSHKIVSIDIEDVQWLHE